MWRTYQGTLYSTISYSLFFFLLLMILKMSLSINQWDELTDPFQRRRRKEKKPTLFIIEAFGKMCFAKEKVFFIQWRSWTNLQFKNVFNDERERFFGVLKWLKYIICDFWYRGTFGPLNGTFLIYSDIWNMS